MLWLDFPQCALFIHPHPGLAIMSTLCTALERLLLHSFSTCLSLPARIIAVWSLFHVYSPCIHYPPIITLHSFPPVCHNFSLHHSLNPIHSISENPFKTNFCFPHLLLTFYPFFHALTFSWMTWTEWLQMTSLPRLPTLLHFFFSCVKKIMSFGHFPFTYTTIRIHF